MKLMLTVLLAVSLASGPALAQDRKKTKAKPKKPEVGASCKVPSVGRCAACNITCPPGEAVACSPGAMAGNVCHAQPSCRCGQ